MAGVCKECSFSLDPWGECIRCVSKTEQAAEQKYCEKLRIIARRELGQRSAEVVAGNLAHRFPEVSLDVIQAIEKTVRRKKKD